MCVCVLGTSKSLKPFSFRCVCVCWALKNILIQMCVGVSVCVCVCVLIYLFPRYTLDVKDPGIVNEPVVLVPTTEHQDMWVWHI